MELIRHLLSIRDLTDDDVRRIVDRGAWFATPAARGWTPLRGCVVGSYFRATSTRTRTAFASAALRLGAGHIAYGPADLQLNTGETVADTARVLAGMLDALVVRTAADPGELRDLCAQDSMPVVNAMSSDEHPTQALADLATMTRHFGHVDGLRILYAGEGNNTATALALALARYSGVELVFATPAGYGLPPALLAEAAEVAAGNKSAVREVHDLAGAVFDGPVDAVYTTRWQTTGTTKADPDWRQVFAPLRIDDALMARHPEAVLMHDLPAHRGEEVTAGVLDGRRSIAFQQAAMKMYGAMAALEWCLDGDPQ